MEILEVLRNVERKVRVNVTAKQPMQVRMGGRPIVLTDSQPRTKRRWMVSRKIRPLYPRKEMAHIVREAELASRSVWTEWNN
jgi:hypothetical protein